MSWRDVAKRAVAAEASGLALAPDPAPTLALEPEPEPERVDYERTEREAIAWADGGLPESWAAALAMLESGPRPAMISESEWRERLDEVWRRADAHGCDFVANGWTFEEVFGVGEHWAQLQKRGGAWLCAGARIVAIDAQRVVFERGGKITTHRRPH